MIEGKKGGEEGDLAKINRQISSNWAYDVSMHEEGELSCKEPYRFVM